MAMDNPTVIETQVFLRDTPNDTSPCKRRYKVVLLVVLFTVVICGIGIVWKLRHQKDAEEIRNVTKSSPTNEGGLVNALSNLTNQENAQDIRNKTQSTYTNYSSINTCLYITSEGFLKKLPNDTFAYGEVCTIGSEFVKKTCGIGKEKSESSHVCEKCTDGSILPSFCFCDKDVHCVKDKELLGSRAADYSKKICQWCADIFKVYFKNRGIPSCFSDFQALVKQTCTEGYTGFMCSVISKRVCSLEFEHPNLEECNRSNLEEECFLRTIWPGTYYHCQPFTDFNINERRKNLEACNLNATP
ncbi:uncharacterized protein LOC127730801 [Mytilus californianus]|uniref:uncharacterized protein LOC127730801 n=1 Tax=Mytilus californianus TaxID=6549 RepID=UPI002245C6FA|nr:uncharacterized protein LOC127730801 [Mytilus californianus]